MSIVSRSVFGSAPLSEAEKAKEKEKKIVELENCTNDGPARAYVNTEILHIHLFTVFLYVWDGIIQQHVDLCYKARKREQEFERIERRLVYLYYLLCVYAF